MRELLQKVLGEIERLPPDEQDSIAERILAELADESAWAQSFANTTDEQWKRMADSVRKEIAEGTVVPIEDVLRSGSADR
ncbi:MAG: hypothetical protein SGI88_19740 [Candidatus Hydrogenedentes bacterium]|nr:hypothetical protein [Candidatus Hydrogenedentota bacterium]